MKKRIISIALCLAMLLSFTATSAFASEVDGNEALSIGASTVNSNFCSLNDETEDKSVVLYSVAVELPVNTSDSYSMFFSAVENLSSKAKNSENLVVQANKDLHDFESVGIYADFCCPIALAEDGEIIYELTLSNNITNQVTIYENLQKDLVLDFYEGDKHTELQFLNSGGYRVNGGEVVPDDDGEVTYTISPETMEAISPRMRNHEYSLAPFGNASDYTIYQGTTSGNKCSWGVTTLVGMTIGAIATIIADRLGIKGAGSVAISLFSSLASALLTRCEIYGMEDEYWSWEFEIYEREDSMSIDRYYQYVGACFSQRDMKGTRFPHTHYYRNWFS